MKKELQIEWIQQKSSDYIGLQIKKQTHSGYSFTETPGAFVYHIPDTNMEVWLESYGSPGFRNVDRNQIKLFTRGDANKEDNRILQIPMEYRCYIKRAINAYNKYFDA